MQGVAESKWGHHKFSSSFPFLSFLPFFSSFSHKESGLISWPTLDIIGTNLALLGNGVDEEICPDIVNIWNQDATIFRSWVWGIFPFLYTGVPMTPFTWVIQRFLYMMLCTVTLDMFDIMNAFSFSRYQSETSCWTNLNDTLSAHVS